MNLTTLPGLGKDRSPIVLELDLSQGVVSGAPSNPLEAVRQRHATSLRAIREGLQRASTDDDVAGLIVHIGTCPVDIATGDEIAALVGDFAQSKPTLAWTESFGELTSGLVGYRIAVACDQIWLQPTGALGLTGVQLGITLLRGGLEKLGLEPQFGQRHEYKSAADQFVASEVSDANRAMMQRIADSVVDDTVARVAAGRGLSADDVRAAMADAPLSAVRAHERGLVDHLGYHDQVYAWVEAEWGRGSMRPLYVQRYAHQDPARQASDLAASLTRTVTRTVTRTPPSVVAVVEVNGPIVLGPGAGRQAGAERVCARLREVGRRDDVRGVVLRVDSPGGSYVASDAIRHEVLALRESGRPVVATMGRVAASGGYFVAMPADEVIAQPSTLTGSIGVLAGKFVSEQLLERVGVVHEPVASGPRAGLMASSTRFSEEEWQVLNGWLDEVYDDFTRKAAHDRDLAWETLEPLARGRVWTGVDAHTHGLVDHLGGMTLALERVAALAGLEADDVALLAPSPLAFLRQLKAPESSRSAATAPQLWASSGAEGLLADAAAWMGLPMPHGVLSLPWSLRLQ